mmetsp:Transcript_9350/g.24849  ORF Transcript_9350/g.24849 Transcript_9350/m.24849 type:complete len:215 (+) Transcript_9350:83-727(+)
MHELLGVPVCAVLEDGLERRLRGAALRAEGRQRVQHHRDAYRRQLVQVPERRLAELGQVGEQRGAGDRSAELLVLLDLSDRLREDAVGAPLVDVESGALDGRVQALDGGGVRPGHDDHLRPPAASRKEPRHHLLGGDHLLARPVPAALRQHLVLHVDGPRAGLLHVAHRPLDVEGRGAEARVDVDQRGNVGHSRQPANVHQDVVQRGDAQVRHA